MASEAIINQILVELKDLKQRFDEIDEDIHREVNPEYIEKIKHIEKEEGQKFKSKEELLNHLKHGIWD